MYKNILVLPDGTEISSGSGTKNAIKNTKSTQTVNSGDELTIGSACSNMIEATLFTPGGDLNITAGDELIHYRADDSGNRVKVGLFTVEEPTRPTPNTIKLVGYDRVARLDKDLTGWLDSLDGWPYSVNGFAAIVCRACGVTFVEQDGLPNGDFLIHRWKKNGTTGRRIMRWLGQIVCRYVYADPEGNIRFGWYKDSGRSFAPAGENYFFAGSLSYENYRVASVEAVQIRLADNDSGVLWPQVPDGTNAYIITGNPILTAYVTEGLLSCLDVIAGELSQVTYTPFQVAVPASMDVRAGDIIHVTDKNGKTFSGCVMSKVTSGQRDTLSATGSPRRDSASAANNQSEEEKRAETEAIANSAQNAANAAQIEASTKKRVFVSQPVPPYDVGDLWSQGSGGDLMRCKTARAYGAFAASDWELASKYIDGEKAGEIAQEKVDSQTQGDIFNKLTNNGALPGLFMDNGQLYVNANYLVTGILTSKDGSSFYLDLDRGVLKGKFEELTISGKSVDSIAQEKANVAEQNANGHADSVAGTAESNAKSFASGAANTAETNAKVYADQAAAGAVSAQSQMDIFNKLTNNGEEQGIFMRDGKVYINLEYLKAGSFTSTAQVFMEPGLEEFETIKNHVLGVAEIPPDRIPLYDFDNNGVISISDALICKAATLRQRSLADWSGAVKTTVTITLDATAADKAIKISGTNMWGREMTYYVGSYGSNIGVHLGDLVINGKTSIGGAVMFETDASYNAKMTIGLTGQPKTISWKDNGDGTYTLIGR